MKKVLPVVATFLVIVTTLPSQQPAPENSEFATKVLPILKESCYGCHSGNRPPGGLRLDARSFAMRAITPGDGKGSRIIHRLEGLDNEPQMPFGMPALSAGK
ncbi:MAG TPA: c-type cytochrome domain-containing protein, partial [Bryobacteraceae bacterium]|nr:c-type cytochrome domain-containing protein [Bryobacteraceae bacterium]